MFVISVLSVFSVVSFSVLVCWHAGVLACCGSAKKRKLLTEIALMGFWTQLRGVAQPG